MVYTVDDVMMLAERATQVKLCQIGTDNCLISKRAMWPIQQLRLGRLINLPHSNSSGCGSDCIGEAWTTTDADVMPLQFLEMDCNFTSDPYSGSIGDSGK